MNSLNFVRYHPSLRGHQDPSASEYSWQTFYKAIQLRLKQQLSGYTIVSYTANSSDPSPGTLTLNEISGKESFKEFTGPIARLSMKSCMSGLYTALDTPLRQSNVDEVLESTPLVTNASWGLESVYCRNRNSRFMAIIDGEAALTKEQVRSSIACFAFGTIMTLFFIVSFLVWMGVSASGIIFITVAYAIYVFNSVRKAVGLTSAYKNVFNDDHAVDLRTKSNAIYQVQETFRVSEPKAWVYWTVFVLEVTVFGLIPLIALFVAGNNRVGIVFIIMFFFCLIRDVCSAPGKDRKKISV